MRCRAGGIRHAAYFAHFFGFGVVWATLVLMNDDQKEAKTIETYDLTAASWAQSHAKVNDWIWAAKRLKSFLPSGTILEIGCGGGRDAVDLLQLGYNYLGTDASAGMVQAARSAVPEAVFEQCNVYDLPKLKRVFDGFWACAVLLHIPRQRIDEALQAMSSVLKPGAVGLISMKDGNTDDFEVRDAHGGHEERLFVYWRREDFEKVLARNGFKVLEYTFKPVSKRTNWHIFFVAKEG